MNCTVDCLFKMQETFLDFFPNGKFISSLVGTSHSIAIKIPFMPSKVSMLGIYNTWLGTIPALSSLYVNSINIDHGSGFIDAYFTLVTSGSSDQYDTVLKEFRSFIEQKAFYMSNFTFEEVILDKK